MLDPRMVKTHKAAVIFHPDVAGSLLGWILAAINGERVLQGASFLASKLEQKIGSELVSIIDDGILSKGINSAFFTGKEFLRRSGARPIGRTMSVAVKNVIKQRPQLVNPKKY